MIRTSMIAMLLMGSMALQAETVVKSPDGRIAVDLTVNDGTPCYEVTIDGKTVIGQSPLGVVTNIGDMSRELTLKGVDVSDINEEYSHRNIKQSHVNYVACQAVAHFEQKGQAVMDITFRVSNRDVAYRYTVLPKKNRGGDTMSCIITEERSSFTLPEGSTSFLAPQSKPMTGFARTAPSYETRFMLAQTNTSKFISSKKTTTTATKVAFIKLEAAAHRAHVAWIQV